jgi:hypothetical protein
MKTRCPGNSIQLKPESRLNDDRTSLAGELTIRRLGREETTDFLLLDLLRRIFGREKIALLHRCRHLQIDNDPRMDVNTDLN